MKKEFFRRGVRMTIPFGGLEERNDPFGSGTFTYEGPQRVDELSQPGRAVEVQQYGEHQYRSASSPICKPSGGYASTNGPAPDFAQILGMPIPVGTKRRLGPRKTDK